MIVGNVSCCILIVPNPICTSGTAGTAGTTGAVRGPDVFLPVQTFPLQPVNISQTANLSVKYSSARSYYVYAYA